MIDQDGPAAAAPIRVAAGNGAAVLPPDRAVDDAAGGVPCPEDVAAAVDGSLAARLRAKHAEIQQGTERFDVPGWGGELVVVVQVIRDRKRLAAGLSNDQLLVAATRQVLARDEDGVMQDVGGWEGVGRIMGLDETVTLGQVVRAVLDNPLRLDGFAESIVAWMMGRQSAIERVLGE